ncbi:hypothetical protein M422DRAFT_274461 [Sphaerobolus stellatus SS14]|uniref:Uncharacterized protein n=1 Tax=Sphaerobolus stellatus (strain SS14) TaxID=990650 RepID=A0A0C9TS46_SPHS4|nr:hypothetical protein M422DRAFT_274461 [Sphaerobolus stellatus SS14]
MTPDARPLAEVKVAKLKDCPMLTAGCINPTTLHSWYSACRRYMKHADKKADEIISIVADTMMEPRLMTWYQAGQARINKLTLNQYIDELAGLVLEKKWDHKLWQKILASSQGDQAFIDWKIELENYNAILTTSSPSYALTADRLMAQLNANLNESLKGSLTMEPVLATSFDACNKPADHKYLPKLTDQEKQLLNEHDGCTRCRTFYAGHHSDTCPMKASGTFPDAMNYRSLTVSMVEAAKPRVAAAFVKAAPCDDNTNSYVSLSKPTPFTVPHLYAALDLTGPAMREFPLPIRALLDVGCPAVIISASLADQLGLRCYDLPLEEDNLSSLLDALLRCREYVRLRVRLGNGKWKSGTFRAKVNTGLPIPLILGLPFLATEHIVIDVNLRTAIDKRTGYDLISPPLLPAPPMAPPYAPPLPTPKKVKPPTPITLEEASEPALVGYLLPEPIVALIREHIEVLTELKLMNEKDCKFKEKFRDRFPI